MLITVAHIYAARWPHAQLPTRLPSERLRSSGRPCAAPSAEALGRRGTYAPRRVPPRSQASTVKPTTGPWCICDSTLPSSRAPLVRALLVSPATGSVAGQRVSAASRDREHSAERTAECRVCLNRLTGTNAKDRRYGRRPNDPPIQDPGGSATALRELNAEAGQKPPAGSSAIAGERARRQLGARRKRAQRRSQCDCLTPYRT